jgi:hypothetical protein
MLAEHQVRYAIVGGVGASPQARLSTPGALTRSRSASSSLRRPPAPDPLSDDSGLDVLVGREKRRRGKNR